MAGITHFGRTVLEIVNGNLNAVCYRDEILVAIVRSFDHLYALILPSLLPKRKRGSLLKMTFCHLLRVQ
jgi:hypothetical protein